MKFEIIIYFLSDTYFIKTRGVKMKLALIVDDSNLIRSAHKRALEEIGITCLEAENGMIALEILMKKHNSIDVMIVDQEMPVMMGDQLVKHVKNHKDFAEIPIIFVSSLDQGEFIKSILALGVYDYLVKPVEKEIFCLKVKNAIGFHKHELELKALTRFVLNKNEELEHTVEERTKELNEMLFALLNALENANYYNDTDTGNHILRVAKYAEVIAIKYGLSQEEIKLIRMFAPIHDIGKIGISELILKKPGRLTPEEFDVIKTHVSIGYNIIKDAPIAKVAKNIVRFHHEKWNGKGYVEGLRGEEIPIEARIVSISDVFDALVSKRIYKDAFDLESIIKIMKEDRGVSFQPELVDILLENIEQFYEIKQKLI